MAQFSWNKVISGFENLHLLQSSQWAEVKNKSGWLPHFLVWQSVDTELELVTSDTGDFSVATPEAAVLILERQILPGLSVMYAPKGPIVRDWTNKSFREQIFHDLENFAKEANAIQLKIDPDLELGRGIPGEEGSSEDSNGPDILVELGQRGWSYSPDQIQFRNTVLVDLLEDEEQILARMKSKTRYNIRLSGRKGITVRLGNEKDLANLFQMYAKTSVRGDFTIRNEEYYLSLWRTFLKEKSLPEIDPIAQPLIAEYEGKPVAGAVIFRFGDRAWYLHGMSLPEHSKKMAPHLIQWEAMRWAKSQGCSVYDMWGAPEVFEESDSMWGVYRFKRGFGGEVVRTMGAWDYPARPFFYHLYTRWVPRLLNIMRWFGNRRTRRHSPDDPN